MTPKEIEEKIEAIGKEFYRLSDAVRLLKAAQPDADGFIVLDEMRFDAERRDVMVADLDAQCLALLESAFRLDPETFEITADGRVGTRLPGGRSHDDAVH